MIIEQWKKVIGFDGYYEVSNLGRVKSVGRYRKKNNGTVYYKGKILKTSITNSGYKQVHLYDKNRGRYNKYVHRMVAESFLISNGNQVNHIDGNKLNNSSDNLEWVTPRENIQHAISSGLINSSGENSKVALFNRKQVDAMRKYYSSGDVSAVVISEIVGASRATIFNILNRTTYK